MVIHYISSTDSCGLICFDIILLHCSMVRLSFLLMPLVHYRLRVLSFFRLARGSILASVIRITPGGPLRVGALCVSGLFIVLYVLIVAQLVWVCETNMELNATGYAPFIGSDFRVVFASR
jgi:hypothetical protein